MTIIDLIYGNLTIIVLSVQLDELDQLDKDFSKNSTVCLLSFIQGSFGSNFLNAIIVQKSPNNEVNINYLASQIYVHV